MSTIDEPTGESLTNGRADATDDGHGSASDDEQADLERRIEELRAENRRLRDDYVRAKQVKHRRTALALLAVGLVGVAGAVAFPTGRTVLLALGATGVFGAVLTNFLSTERVIPAAVGRSAYDAHAETGASVRDELGLADVSVYAPVESAETETCAPVRLFVPQSSNYEMPSRRELRSTFVAPDDERRRGVSLTPAAGRMLAEFERATTEEVRGEPETLTPALCDALVEQFELVRSAESELDMEAQRITVGVSGCAYPPVTGFDNPVASFLGGGVAHGFDASVTVETERVEEGEAEFLVTCRW
mgnify:CR=1 FL=1